jgi:hypothetical protein
VIEAKGGVAVSKWMFLLIWNVVLTVAVGWQLVGGLLNPPEQQPTVTVFEKALIQVLLSIDQNLEYMVNK